MNEEVLDMSIRKFLKKLGVTAQREIEMAVRRAAAEGRLNEGQELSAKALLRVEEIGLSLNIEGSIKFDETRPGSA